MHVHGFSDQPSNGTLVVCGDTVSIVPVSACAAALCSQSLAVIRAAIPCIRTAVVSNLHPQHHGPVLGELDKVARVRLRLRCCWLCDCLVCVGVANIFVCARAPGLRHAL